MPIYIVAKHMILLDRLEGRERDWNTSSLEGSSHTSSYKDTLVLFLSDYVFRLKREA